MRWPWWDNLHEQDKLLQAVICAAITLSGWGVTHISWEQLWAHCWVDAVTDGPVPVWEMWENLDETHGNRSFSIPSAQIFIVSLQLLRWKFTVDTWDKKKREQSFLLLRVRWGEYLLAFDMNIIWYSWWLSSRPAENERSNPIHFCHVKNCTKSVWLMFFRERNLALSIIWSKRKCKAIAFSELLLRTLKKKL